MESFILERSWKELLLMGGQYLVYRVDNGHGSVLYFFEIANQEIVPYDFVWDPVAGGANVPFFRPTEVVGPGINQQSLIISKPGDKDSSNPFPMVIQVFQGFNQPLDRVRMRIPVPHEHGELPNQAISGPTLGGNYGWWFEGHESTYDNPTGRGMYILLDKMDLEMGLEHRTDIIVTPSSMFLINKLEVHPLDPSDEHDRKIIAAILRNEKRSKYWTPALRDVTYKPEQGLKAYDVEAVHWNGRKAVTPENVVVIA